MRARARQLLLLAAAAVVALVVASPGASRDSKAPGTSYEARTTSGERGALTVDARPPNTIVHGGPPRTTRSRTASFHIVSTKSGSRFQCKLDRRPWRSCRASVTYRGLSRGRHTFGARAIDSSGAVDPTPATRTWRIR
ncbi:MAG: hypothetical protein M3123_06440 [Actinomycetota bacterium]|nr:hypothetical protein [Actinomycetota bacterium]